ncbi:putative Transcriptional regulatory moc3 [Seiridium unicorne]|uniref:Transcriptional regulatory moc3 n=1 Tax=Seiridium unicorne TaxID=138068 RepID=A0ABR2UXY0_9PEZI
MLDNFVWRSFGAGWIDKAASGKIGQLSLETAKALSQTNLGRMEQVQRLKCKGALQYGRCLQSMVDKLAISNIGKAQELIVPIILLLMNAVFYPYRQWEGFLANQVGGDDEWSSLDSDRTTVMSQMKGIATILYMTAPKAFQKPPLLRVFECARTLLVSTMEDLLTGQNEMCTP